jgi:hypothetical protein
MVLSMLKLNLVLALLFLNVSAYATDYYENFNSSFPEPQVVTKVYMGDKMLEQKYGYSEQCYTPKKTFTLTKKIESDKSVCYTSSVQIGKKGRNYTIEKGETMCGTGVPFPNEMYAFYPMDDYSSINEDALITTSYQSWLRKKGKVVIYHQNPFKKVAKMTDAEFESSFDKTEFYWKALLQFDRGVSICKAIDNRLSGIFYDVNASISKTVSPAFFSEGVSSVSVKQRSDGFDITANHSQGSSTWNLSEEEFNNSFEETSKVIVVESSMQRTIEYAGINGNLVKFIYSEFKDGMARDAFTREFTIDLSGDSVAAYKGAVFEVIKATNSTIEYKLIRNFPVET